MWKKEWTKKKKRTTKNTTSSGDERLTGSAPDRCGVTFAAAPRSLRRHVRRGDVPEHSRLGRSQVRDTPYLGGAPQFRDTPILGLEDAR